MAHIGVSEVNDRVVRSLSTEFTTETSHSRLVGFTLLKIRKAPLELMSVLAHKRSTEFHFLEMARFPQADFKFALTRTGLMDLIRTATHTTT